MSTKADLISHVLERGTENIIPGKKELKKLLESGKTLSVYLGIDPTATKIHLGHAVPLRKLQKLALLGHKVHFLIGDFTALVGDTSDKDTERPVLTKEEIENNFQSYKQQASKVLDFDKVKVVHNSDWLSKLTFGDVLSLTMQFSLNDFISRELIRKRLDGGNRVGLAETMYPLMQGYDSFHLDTDIQLGGTDQTFNMQAGRYLIKRLKNKESFILANGFLPGTDGRKMSKTWNNAVWLDDAPEDMYGKIMSLKDELIPDYYKYATDESDQAIAEVEKALNSGGNPLEIKKRLAATIVTELYDAKAASKAAKHFSKAVQQKKAPDNIEVIKISGQQISMEELIEKIVDLNLSPSKSQARRLHQQGGLYLNDAKIASDAKTLDLNSGENIIRVGKRKYFKIVVM